MMLKNKIIILKAETSDAAQISEIEKSCFSAPWSLSQIEHEINNEMCTFIVAKSGAEICGYISGQLVADEFYISNIAVKEKYRSNKIGSALIEKLLEILKNRICAFATLEVRVSNTAARNLYEKYGFINQGERKNFYSSPKENACIYTLYF